MVVKEEKEVKKKGKKKRGKHAVHAEEPGAEGQVNVDAAAAQENRVDVEGEPAESEDNVGAEEESDGEDHREEGLEDEEGEGGEAHDKSTSPMIGDENNEEKQ